MQLTYGLIALAATTLLTLSEARQCVSFQLGSKGTSVAQQRQLLTRQLCPNKQPHTSVRSRIRGTATSEAVDATSEAVDSRMPAKDWISEWKESPTIRKIVLKKIEREHKTMLGKELRDRRKQGHVIQAKVKRDPNAKTTPVRFRFKSDEFLGLREDRIVEAQTGDNMLEVFDNTGGIVPSFCCEGICYTCVAALQGLDDKGNKVGEMGVVRCCITEVTEPPKGSTEIEVSIPDWVKEDE